MRGRRTARGGLVGIAAMGALMTAGPAGAVGNAEDGGAYRMAPGANPVKGAATAGDAPLLAEGMYTDSLKPGATKYYGVELDDASSAYVSAIAVPREGSVPGAQDGIGVSMRTADGRRCGLGHQRTFAAQGGAYPTGDYAERVVEPRGVCRGAGRYVVTVTRGEATGGSTAALPIELAYMSEPAVRKGTEGSPAAGGKSTPGAAQESAASRPAASGGAEQSAEGGTGFNDAAEVRAGSVKGSVEPGGTRFYRVPVGWGQRLRVTADFGAAPSGSAFHAANGVRLALSNTARGLVANRNGGYQGKPKSLSLETAPVAYANRLGAGLDAATKAMRFAGAYYLQVSVHPAVAGKVSGSVPFTLRIGVEGEPAKGPEYVKDPGEFGGSMLPLAGDGTVPGGVRDGGSGRSDRLRLVGYAGVGTGSVLLLGLGGWSLAARRWKN
ncbi:hypothetical protein SNS2_3483 [Streptomyces netropsis]|nr:hypothetical protein SNS2_3483 [Streptomyces netropsis]